MMSSIDFTYFPSRTIDLFDFSESIIKLISDFDVHAMFDIEKLLNNWGDEFDFHQTYYSNSSNFEINSRKKVDGFLNYKLLYNSNDFSISLSYEVFADMVNGILQVTVNRLNKDNSLVLKLNEFCKATESIQNHSKPSRQSSVSGPNDSFKQENYEVTKEPKNSPPKLKSLKLKEKVSYAKEGEGSIVYVLRINKNDVSIGEFDHNIKDSGGTNEVSFKDFIEKKEGHDFVSKYLGDDVLIEVLKTVKSRYKLSVKKLRKRVANTSYHRDGQGSIVYTISITNKTVTVGEFNRMNTQGGGARSYTFKDFLNEKAGQDFVIAYFDQKTLDKVILDVKARM